MNIAMELENLALGEVTLEEGSKTVRAALSHIDRQSASKLYEALRSWTWKALEARRRDEELSGWMDILARASSHIEGVAADLSVKIEAFIELLQASVMSAASASERNPLERKHVRAALGAVYRSDGRMRRRDLMDHLGLKAPNLSRVMTSLLDDGFVMREVDGREIFYRLTIKGRGAATSLLAHESVMIQVVDKSVDHLAKIVNIVTISHDGFHIQDAKQTVDDPFEGYHLLKRKFTDPYEAAKDRPNVGGGFASYDTSALRAEGVRV